MGAGTRLVKSSIFALMCIATYCKGQRFSQSCNQNIRIPNERYGNLRQIAGNQNRYNQFLDPPGFDPLGRKKRSTHDEPAYKEPTHGKYSKNYAGKVGLLALATTLAGSPAYDYVTCDLTPPGEPRPGEAKGGLAPEFATERIRSLVPEGLTPISYWIQPLNERYTAEALIYSELPDIQRYKPYRCNRVPEPKPNYHQPEPEYHQPGPAYHQPEPAYHQPEPAYHQPKPEYHQPEPEYHQPEPSYRGYTKRDIHSGYSANLGYHKTKDDRSLTTQLKCLRTEIAANNNPDLIQELKKISRKPNSELFDLRANNDNNYNQLYGYEEPKLNETHEHESEINSIDDCIDGIEEPLYGLVILVTLVEDQPCQIKNTTYEKPTYREPKTYRGKRDVPYSQYEQPKEPELPFCEANAPIISKTDKPVYQTFSYEDYLRAKRANEVFISSGRDCRINAL